MNSILSANYPDVDLFAKNTTILDEIRKSTYYTFLIKFQLSMTLSERLQFCKVCSHRKMDIQNGIYCGQTGQKPAFEGKCESFSVDNDELKKEKARQIARQQHEQKESSYFAPEQKGMKKGVLGGFVMILIAVVWFFGGLAIDRIFFYPPVLLIIGVVAVIKGAAEKNFAGEKYRSTY